MEDAEQDKKEKRFLLHLKVSLPLEQHVFDSVKYIHPYLEVAPCKEINGLFYGMEYCTYRTIQ
jgi:hypothetical protein